MDFGRGAYPYKGGLYVVSETLFIQKGGWQKVTLFYRTGDVPVERCWLRASGWALADDLIHRRRCLCALSATATRAGHCGHLRRGWIGNKTMVEPDVHGAALMSLVRAIVAGNATAVSRLVANSPALARAYFDKGATCQAAAAYYWMVAALHPDR